MLTTATSGNTGGLPLRIEVPPEEHPIVHGEAGSSRVVRPAARPLPHALQHQGERRRRAHVGAAHAGVGRGERHLRPAVRPRRRLFVDGGDGRRRRRADRAALRPEQRVDGDLRGEGGGVHDGERLEFTAGPMFIHTSKK